MHSTRSESRRASISFSNKLNESLGHPSMKDGRVKKSVIRRNRAIVFLIALSLWLILRWLFSTESAIVEGIQEVEPGEGSVEEAMRLFSDLAPFISDSFSPITPKIPLKIDEKLILYAPDVAAVSQPITLTFICHHENIKLNCPSSYRVLFVGTTMYSPPHLARSHEIKSDGKEIKIVISALHDPGHYQIYAWPEHELCDQWNEATIQYHKLAVRPSEIEILGREFNEGLEACRSSAEMLDGRWISKRSIRKENLFSSSKNFQWLHPHFLSTFYRPSYVYQWAFVPFQCKIPHLSFKNWIDLVKPPSLLLIGDSVLRDLYCTMIWPSLNGAEDVEGGVCKFSHKEVELYHKSNKHLEYSQLDSNAVSDVNFLWLPTGDSEKLKNYLKDVKPTHIIFNIALWLAKDSPEVYSEKLKPMLEILSSLEAKIIARTSASMVENIQCFDRIGQRKDLEENNRALLTLLESYPSITPLDVYPIFNSRPDSTSDGRHTAGIGDSWMDRPETGAAESYVSDLIFANWLLE